MQCARLISGITFIWYKQDQSIRKPSNLQVFGTKKARHKTKNKPRKKRKKKEKKRQSAWTIYPTPTTVTYVCG